MPVLPGVAARALAPAGDLREQALGGDAKRVPVPGHAAAPARRPASARERHGGPERRSARRLLDRAAPDPGAIRPGSLRPRRPQRQLQLHRRHHRPRPRARPRRRPVPRPGGPGPHALQLPPPPARLRLIPNGSVFHAPRPVPLPRGTASWRPVCTGLPGISRHGSRPALSTCAVGPAPAGPTAHGDGGSGTGRRLGCYSAEGASTQNRPTPAARRMWSPSRTE